MLERPKFLGRTLDPKTMTYNFSDGSGRVPEEMRQDVLDMVELYPNNGIVALCTLFDWKKRLGLE